MLRDQRGIFPSVRPVQQHRMPASPPAILQQPGRPAAEETLLTGRQKIFWAKSA